ncbi:hypothetical protein JTE90_007458 [Oedothorax gibbosus]|uniref:Uncharacterized protein n=1 Tax=Oedothorax gibbosus TaxID=931172 RepID=A0AAV6U847_9ARAC|nr:hypothetical protein JTE90_007458 [Oedothorax gibbosus]
MSAVLRLLCCVCCFNTLIALVHATQCDPSRFLCSGMCPPFPEDAAPPTDEAVCSRDPDSDTCVCWLHNPDSQLHTLFQCEARINGSTSKVACYPPSDCFLPDQNVGCLIVLQCQCVLFDQSYQYQKTDSWKRVKAVVHTMKKTADNQDGYPIERMQDIREFSLKHLLFLLGFVVAPLLCWCLLNFFHDGKCRKKPPAPPEAQPMPTSRNSTLDNSSDFDIVQPTSSPRHLASSQSCSIPIPSAPDIDAVLESDSQQEAFLKCESPPPYCESTDRSCPIDCGPPPTYEDALRGSDLNVQQLWQTVFILQYVARGKEKGWGSPKPSALVNDGGLSQTALNEVGSKVVRFGTGNVPQSRERQLAKYFQNILIIYTCFTNCVAQHNIVQGIGTHGKYYCFNSFYTFTDTNRLAFTVDSEVGFQAVRLQIPHMLGTAF